MSSPGFAHNSLQVYGGISFYLEQLQKIIVQLSK